MSTRSEGRKPALRELVRGTVANAILDAAETVGAQRGPEGTTIAAIAEQAGVAVGTLYNYFPDRDALLAALFKARRDTIMPRIEALAESLKDRRKGGADQVEATLRAYLEGVLGILEDHRNYCRLAVLDDGTFARIKGRQRPALDNMIDTVADIVKPVAGQAAGVHARMIVGALRAMLRERLEQEMPLAPDGELIAATFVHGIKRR